MPGAESLRPVHSPVPIVYVPAGSVAPSVKSPSSSTSGDGHCSDPVTFTPCGALVDVRSAREVSPKLLEPVTRAVMTVLGQSAWANRDPTGVPRPVARS